MQKTDFIKAVAEKAGVSQKETKLVVDSALDVITEQLRNGEKVTLTGFGTFEVRSRQARTGMAPIEWVTQAGGWSPHGAAAGTTPATSVSSGSRVEG